MSFQTGTRDGYNSSLSGLFGDICFHLADFRSYVDAQQRAVDLFRDQTAWVRKAVLKVARMGKFSSDRSIREYAQKIWNLQPVPVKIAAAKLTT